MAIIITPSPEAVTTCVENAAHIGPHLGEMIARYCVPFLPNDPQVSKTLQDAGMTIIPGIRLEDAVETAMWAHAAPPVIFEGYVRKVYAEGRVYCRARVA
jgi:hypothetical protein